MDQGAGAPAGSGARVAKAFMLSAIVWLVIAITLGFIQAIEFIAPDFAAGIPWLVFPRIRQVHVNGLALGWLSMAMIGGWYYIVPRLTKSKLHSERLGLVTMWLWNIALMIGLIGLLAGFTQAREYAELAWPVDIGVLLVLLLTGYNLLMTIAKREEKDLYVSLWYVIGSLIWFPIVFAIGNVVWGLPESWTLTGILNNPGALAGLNDAIWGWFYGHNILGLWFTTGAIPLLYYIVPRETKRPLYAYKLALIAFWFLAFFYTAVGTHHILQAPVPEWLKTVSVVTSMGLLIPVGAFIINMFMTVRGQWRKAYYSIPLRFALTGTLFYLLVSFQGATQALRGFNQYIHFTNYSVAHAHLALLGFVAYTMWAAVYYILPRIAGHALFSERLAWTHWWLTTVGFLGFFLVLTAAGLAQAAGFAQGIPVIQILPGIRPLLIGRAAAGTVIIAAQYLFAFNMARTLAGKRAKYELDEQAEADIPTTPATA
jgi:cbb3-type cytochrome c oxidase subunit I